MLVTGQKVLQKLRNNSELCLRFSSDFWRLPNLQNIEKIALKTKVTANDVLILGIRYIQKLNLDCHCPQIWIHSGLSKNIILSFFFAKFIIYSILDTFTVVVVLTQTFASYVTGLFFCMWSCEILFTSLCTRSLLFASLWSLLFAKYRITLWSLTLWVPTDLLVQKCRVTHGRPQLTF